MRHILMAIVVSSASVASAAAQTHQSHTPPPPPPPVTVAPPIILPFPPLMTPPAGGLTSGVPFRPSDPTMPPRDLYRAGAQRPGRLPAYGGGGYYGVADTEAPPATGSSMRSTATGFLRLTITPGDAQAFVDSAYVGTADDLDKRPMAFSEGMHRLEVRAPGHQGVSVDLRIDRGATLTYRNALTSTRPAPSEPDRTPVASSAPLYVIANCYLGNMPPRPERLPAGCDVRNVRVVGTR